MENRTVPSTFTVTNLGDAGVGSGLQGDLRYAVNTANANPDLTNKIVFQPGLTGTITLTQGELAVTKDLEIDGPGMGLLTVSGNHQSGVFDIPAGAPVQNVLLADLTVADGIGVFKDFGNGFFGYQGGGIYNDHANLTLTRVAVTGNSVSGTEFVFGGAIYSLSGNLVLDSSVVANNTATGQFSSGPGLDSASNTSTVSLIDSTFANNTGTNGDGGAGVSGGQLTVLRCTFTHGGLGAGVTSSATVTDSTFTDNGGAGVFTDGLMTITDSTIANNPDIGVWNGGGELVITGSTISGNRNGGINAFFGDTQVINSTVSDNVAKESGGGIFYEKGSLEVTSSTITGNRAQLGQGGGIYAYPSGDHRVYVRNSIVAGNSAAGKGPDVDADVVSMGYNLIGQSDNSTGWLTTDLTGTSANPLDPQLGPLQDNGGPTLTHAVLAGSPAIAHGDPALRTSPDQRGSLRFANKVTIGAVEATDASTLQVLAPDQVAAGQPFALTVTALDQWGNVATTYTGQVHFSSTDFGAQLPDDTAFAPTDEGVHTFTASLATPGQQTILVYDVNHVTLTGTASITVTDQATGLSSGAVDRVFAAADASESVSAGTGVSSQPARALDAIGAPATVAGGTSGQTVLTASPGDGVSVDSLDAGGPLGQAL